jgi:hypothetical protein
MNEVHIAMQIGCLECGEPSKVLGVFDSIEMAEKVIRFAQSWHELNWKGERRYSVFTVKLNVVYPYQDDVELIDTTPVMVTDLDPEDGE